MRSFNYRVHHLMGNLKTLLLTCNFPFFSPKAVVNKTVTKKKSILTYAVLTNIKLQLLDNSNKAVLLEVDSFALKRGYVQVSFVQLCM